MIIFSTAGRPSSPDSSPLLLTARRLDHAAINQLKVVCCGLHESIKPRLETKETLHEIVNCIANFFKAEPGHDEAVLFCCYILKGLGFHPLRSIETKLARYNLTKYPAVDCRLSFLKFLLKLRDKDYQDLHGAVFTALGTACADAAVDKKWNLIDYIFDEGIVDANPIQDIAMVYTIARCFNQRQMFSDLCRRHHIQPQGIQYHCYTYTEALSQF